MADSLVAGGQGSIIVVHAVSAPRAVRVLVLDDEHERMRARAT